MSYLNLTILTFFPLGFNLQKYKKNTQAEQKSTDKWCVRILIATTIEVFTSNVLRSLNG